MIPYISVIVVAYKAEKEIKDCLDSLFVQSYPKDRYEVIVVVDDEGTYNAINKYPIKIHLREKKGNIPSARNEGIRISQGEIIAFTDSDCIVDRRWLDNISRSFQEHPDCVAVGGPIKPYGSDPVSLSLAVLNMVGYSGGSISFERPFPTSNAAYGRNIFTEIGMFDEEANVGEDMDLYRRIKHNGLSAVYDPEIFVYHKHRIDLRDIFLWCYSVGTKSSHIRKKYGTYINSIRIRIPALSLLALFIVSPILYLNHLLIPSLITILLGTYVSLYGVYHKSRYFSLKVLLILPIVVSLISSGFLVSDFSLFTERRK